MPQKEENDRPVVSKIAWYTVRIRLIRKGTKRERKEEEIQNINTYTNTNLIPSRRFRSAHYPITHKALITQLISIYLITPSLPGTVSIGPGRESPPPRNPPSPALQSLLLRDHSSVSFSRCTFDPPRKSSTRPCYSHSCRTRIARVDVRCECIVELIETAKKIIEHQLQTQDISTTRGKVDVYGLDFVTIEIMSGKEVRTTIHALTEGPLSSSPRSRKFSARIPRTDTVLRTYNGGNSLLIFPRNSHKVRSAERCIMPKADPARARPAATFQTRICPA